MSCASGPERALGFAASASSGHVYLPRNQPWAERLVNQLCAFTGEDGKVDDGVDVCSLFSRGLDMTRNATKPPERPEPKKIEIGSRDHLEYEDRMREREAAERKRAYR